jgi:hypothetical protein
MLLEWTWWNFKTYNFFEVLRFWKKGLESQELIFKITWQKKMFNGFKMFSFKHMSHMQKIICIKKHVWLSIEIHFEFF